MVKSMTSIKLFSLKTSRSGRVFSSATFVSLGRDGRYLVHWVAGQPQEFFTLQDAISSVLAAYGYKNPPRELLGEVLFNDLQARQALGL